MFKPYGAIKVVLREDTDSGLRVHPVQWAHSYEYPYASAADADATDAWIGITLEAGLAGEVVSVMPPYSGLVKVKIECQTAHVRTGYWASATNNGYFTCHHGSGEVATGLIVTPDLDEDVSPGKIVEAMIFTGRFCYDGGNFNP